MGEIPEDIMDMGRAVGRTLSRTPLRDEALVIARAILAERQRCAAVARAYLEDLAGCDLRDDEPEHIARAILNP